MFHSHSSMIRNQLLRSLPPEDLRLLTPLLKQVSLKSKDVLVEPDTSIPLVYFLEEGIASVVAMTADDQRLEVSNIGREGMACVAVPLDMEETPLLTFVQVPGSAFCMQADDLRGAMDDIPALRKVLLRYAHTVLIQTAQTALAAGRFTVNQRLARWILMGHDRIEGNNLPLTHEYLALMLGVRRSGVTNSLHILEGEGMISARRAHVVVRDRAKLMNMAGASYGSAESEYARAMGKGPAYRFMPSEAYALSN